MTTTHTPQEGQQAKPPKSAMSEPSTTSSTPLHQRLLLKRRPQGQTRPKDFELSESPLSPLAEGMARVKVHTLSIDPTNRIWMGQDSYLPIASLDEPVRAIGVGQILESRHADLKEGQWVAGLLGWQNFADVSPEGLNVLPDMVAVRPSLALGVLGHTGMSAYFGLLDIAKPKPGDTLVVSAAAGAVGSIACQIGKLKGCRVVAIAGGEKKGVWLKDTAKVDAFVDYKQADFPQALKAACPNGIDVYFENVGGKVSQAVFPLLNLHSRISLCGLISGYNLQNSPSAQSASANDLALMSDHGYSLQDILIKRIDVRGFIILDYAQRYGEAAAEMLPWIQSGQIRFEETVFEGLESAPKALDSMFAGGNIGKTLVRL